MGQRGRESAAPERSRSATQRKVIAGARTHRRAALALAWWACSLLAILLPLRAVATPAAVGSPVPAGTRPPANDACLMCHRDPELARHTGSFGSLSVDAGSLGTSVHGALECRACHGEVRGAPHSPKPAPVRCASCHREAASALAGSVHLGDEGVEAACRRCHGTHAVSRVTGAGTAACATCHAQQVAEHRASLHGVARANGDTEASTCRDCHGSAHGMLRHDDPRSPVNRANLANTCAHCHEDRELMTRRRITIPDAVQLFRSSVHGRSKRPDAATCSDCHESHNLRRATEPTSSIYRMNIPATCGHCHLRELTAFRASIHGSALARGVTAAPVCTDCHGEHLIRGPHDLDSPVAAARITETCSRCHEATGIRETFGLPAGRLSSYRDSFHGLAARGGSPVVANCASCHGYHDVLPSSDPRSSVSPARLGETCGRCHAGAGTTFRIGQVHVTMATPSQPVAFWARRTYLWLIALTIGFMLLHNGADFVRKLRRSLSVQVGRVAPHAHAMGLWFERMTLVERIQHALLAISFFTLVYTGFALKFPEAYPFSWLARLESGYAWRSIVHRVAAVVMIAVSLVHVAYLFTARGRSLIAALLPGLRDAQEMLHNTLHLFGLRRDAPRFGRFSYIEKAEYWALIWGTLVMAATGFLLWFENPALRVMPKWVLDLATVVHYYEAWLAFLAIVVWHLYQNIVNPDIYPMNWTWLTGRIPGWQMQHEHPREYDQLVAQEVAQDATMDATEVGDESADVAPGTEAAPGGTEPESP